MIRPENLFNYHKINSPSEVEIAKALHSFVLANQLSIAELDRLVYAYKEKVQTMPVGQQFHEQDLLPPLLATAS